MQSCTATASAALARLPLQIFRGRRAKQYGECDLERVHTPALPPSLKLPSIVISSGGMGKQPAPRKLSSSAATKPSGGNSTRRTVCWMFLYPRIGLQRPGIVAFVCQGEAAGHGAACGDEA